MIKFLIILLLIPSLSYAKTETIGVSLIAREAIVIETNPTPLEGIREIKENEVIYL